MSVLLIVLAVYLVIYAFALMRILASIKNPYRSLSWILFVTFIPVIGIITYFLFGRNIRRDKIFARRRPFYGLSSVEYSEGLMKHAKLLSAGVRIYLYHDGFLHGKVMFSDDNVISVGSANIDERSFTSNFEINAVVYNAETTKAMKKQFFKELSNSEELTLQSFDDRVDRNKLLESIARLTSPML